MYIQKKKESEFTNQNRTLGCSGSHHFQEGRQGFGKKWEMAAVREAFLPLYTRFDIEGFQSHIPVTDVVNFVSNSEWSYVEGWLIRMQLLPNFGHTGIDLEDETGSRCLWVFFPSVPKAEANKEVSQGLIRARQGRCPNWNADREQAGGGLSSRPETQWLAQGRSSGCLQPQLSCRAGSRVEGMETRGAASHSPPLTMWPQVCAAISSSLKEIVGSWRACTLPLPPVPILILCPNSSSPGLDS